MEKEVMIEVMSHSVFGRRYSKLDSEKQKDIQDIVSITDEMEVENIERSLSLVLYRKDFELLKGIDRALIKSIAEDTFENYYYERGCNHVER